MNKNKISQHFCTYMIFYCYELFRTLKLTLPTFALSSMNLEPLLLLCFPQFLSSTHITFLQRGETAIMSWFQNQRYAWDFSKIEEPQHEVNNYQWSTNKLTGFDRFVQTSSSPIFFWIRPSQKHFWKADLINIFTRNKEKRS